MSQTAHPRANRNKNPFIPINQPYPGESGTLVNVASKRLYFVSESGLKRFCVSPVFHKQEKPDRIVPGAYEYPCKGTKAPIERIVRFDWVVPLGLPLEEDGVPTIGSNRVCCARESPRSPEKPRNCGDAIAAQGIQPAGAQPP